MKDRLSKISKKATFAFCLLAACGLNYSCADEYKLDDEAPTYLGSSIYGYLKEQGNYTNFVKMIDELGLEEVLSTTGSKTLFVADDAAFEKFYKSNVNTDEDYAWHNATSYDKLTLAQKKILVHAAMLNNAYLLEMLPREQGNPPVKGASMRKANSIELTDSITFFTSENLPQSDDTTATDYWKFYREEKAYDINGTQKRGIYMVTDNTNPMLVYFISEQMSKAGITNEDFKILTGKERTSNDAHIYFNKVIKQDITCQNGYINVLDSVLIPPGNMAEVIRTNGKTDIFSHILDRFSAPFYNKTVTENYNVLHKDNPVDSVFVKKYFSKWTNQMTEGFDQNFVNNEGVLGVGPDNENPASEFGVLKFDPGWNTYKSQSTGATATGDMAAMFVPTDKVLKAYFLPGGAGSDLIDNYGDRDNTEENLLHNIDMIPLGVINTFMSNLMQTSFINSVPSKFGQILDQANDNLFQNPQEAIDNINEVKIANNGVVYLMDKVYPPVDYASVASPAFINEENSIMKYAIFNGAGLDAKPEKMGLHYYAYLRAMGSKFTLLLPSNEALQYYVDPLSLSGQTAPRVLKFTYNSSKNVPVDCKPYIYDPATGLIGNAIVGTTTITENEIISRLKDILETHTIVHNETEPQGVKSGNEYYISKNGAPIHVKNTSGDDMNMKFQGAMQVEQELNGYTAQPSNPGVLYSSVTIPYNKVNGWTYCLDAPIAASVRSVSNVLSNNNEPENNPYSMFYDLCAGVNADLLVNCGIIDSKLEEKEQAKQAQKYMIFIYDKDVPSLDTRVSFFNNYRYTVYAPTNEAIQKAIDENDLPTWETIEAYIQEHIEDPNYVEKYQPIAKAMASCLLNFIRGHFQDNSIYADKLPFDATSYETATLDDNGKKFVSITVESAGNGQLRIYKERKDGSMIFDCEVTDIKNKMAREYMTNKDFKSDNVSLTDSKIESSSYAVIHQVNGVLHYTDLKDYNNSYAEKYWRNLETAKQTAAKFRIKNK